MSKKVPQINLRRRQLDKSFSKLRELDLPKPPTGGWIREIRESLGLSATHLAPRLGITQPSVADLENSEAKGTITLNTLDKAAAALGCRLVYLLLPAKSLESFLQNQAYLVAKRLVNRLDHTMTLENQQTSKAERQRQIDEIAEELMRTLSKALWSEQ